MLTKVHSFLRDEEGASAVEYGLVVGLIAVAIIAVLIAIGPKLNTLFEKVNNGLSGTAP